MTQNPKPGDIEYVNLSIPFANEVKRRRALDMKRLIDALTDIAENSKFGNPLPVEALERIAQAALNGR